METQMNLNDFALVVNIIDVCSQRGAFRGEELVAVGTLRQKFADVVKADTPKPEAAQVETETEGGAE